jgi:DNA primase
MNDKPSAPDRSEVIGLPAGSSGRDWAVWLQRVHCSPGPRPSASSPGQTRAAWTALTHVARREGFNVERSDCAGAEGFTTFRTRRIRIRPDTTPVQAVIALAHQLGHVLLHAQIATLEPSGTVPCTGIRKVEADSVAYLAATDAAIDTTGITFPHVSSWAGTDQRANPATTIDAVAHRIFDAGARITARLDEAGIARRRLPAPARTASSETADQLTGPQPTQDEHARIHHSATLFFRNQMPSSWVPAYLAQRGLGPAIQEQWQAGYAPATWDALTSNLRAAGYPDMLIEAAGLARRSRRNTLIDTFRDRATLPIRAANGTIIAFIGRAADHAAPGTPKYLNSPATAVYRKGEILFGLAEARDPLATAARPVIVEGPLDAIAVTTAGDGKYVGLAPCGTALTAHQVAALAVVTDLGATGVTVGFDSDQAGRRAAIRAYHLLVPYTDKLAAATLPAGQDPAQVLADSGTAALADLLASNTRPLPDLVINAEVARWSRWLRYPEGQIHALRATAPVIAAMPSAHVARQVARLAAILKLDHATVTEAVADAVTALASEPAADHNHEASAPRTKRRPASVIHATSPPQPHSAAPQVRAGTVAARRRESSRPPIQSRSAPRSS